jgi:1-acyl-sn-glycerol-3-phosphate acyltransferase
MTINNSDAVFEKHFPWVKRAHVIVEFGEPIYVDKLSKQEQKSLAPMIQDIIGKTYTKNKELV